MPAGITLGAIVVWLFVLAGVAIVVDVRRRIAADRAVRREAVLRRLYEETQRYRREERISH